MVFYEKLMYLIEERKITKNKLLTDLKLNRNSIQNWQKQGSKPRTDTMAQIADYFNVSVDYLIGRADSEINRENPGGVVLNEKERDFIFEFRRLSDSEKDSILTVISNYLNKK